MLDNREIENELKEINSKHHLVIQNHESKFWTHYGVNVFESENVTHTAQHTEVGILA